MRIGLVTSASAGRGIRPIAAKPAEYLSTVLRDVVMAAPYLCCGLMPMRLAPKREASVWQTRNTVNEVRENGIEKRSPLDRGHRRGRAVHRLRPLPKHCARCDHDGDELQGRPASGGTEPARQR